MTSKLDSRRPRPDAYDDLWLLLPVFMVFLVLIVSFADAIPVRGPQSGHLGHRMLPVPVPTAASNGAQEPRLLPDPSVPPASTAITTDAAVESREVATF